MRHSRSLIVTGLSLAAVIGVAAAADKATPTWPQWQGPDRTNVSKETGLLKTWPAAGPKLLWTFDNAGVGFSGPAIVGDRLFTMGARDRKDHLLILDAKNGTEVKAVEIGRQYDNGWGDGPRCTPTVDGDFVYVIGGRGDLACLKISDGSKVWSKNLAKDLGGEVPGWGYCESPLVDGDNVICTPGGGQGTFAALDKKSGNVVWRSKALTDGAAYSSIITAEINGVRQYINMTAGGEASVAAKDGRLLWKNTAAQNGTAIIPTPIYADSQVYVTSGYGAGCGLLQITPDGQGFKAETVYTNKLMSNQHGGVVLVDGHIYGFSDSKGWICQDLKNGKIVWDGKGKLGKGSVTCADGKLYCYTEDDGIVVLADAAPKEWVERGRFTIPQKTKKDRKSGQIWTHPVVCDGKLYLRDQELIFCFDVKDGGAK